jgi:hypothetical protein
MKLYLLALLLLIGAVNATNFTVNNCSDLAGTTLDLDSLDRLHILDVNTRLTCSLTPVVCAPTLNSTCTANATYILNVTVNSTCTANVTNTTLDFNVTSYLANFTSPLCTNQTINETIKVNFNRPLNYSEQLMNSDANLSTSCPPFPTVQEVRERDKEYFAFVCGNKNYTECANMTQPPTGATCNSIGFIAASACSTIPNQNQTTTTSDNTGIIVAAIIIAGIIAYWGSQRKNERSGL